MQQTEYPFTLAQWEALNEQQKNVINYLAEVHTGSAITQAEVTDVSISESLSILACCKGPVPHADLDDHVTISIRRKFHTVYSTAVQLAEQELKRRGLTERLESKFCLIIEPSADSSTHVVVVDYEQPTCYLHDWIEARHFHFASLAELADKVLKIRNSLVEKATAKAEILVVVEGGVVQDILGAPDTVQVTVIDYDTDGADQEDIKASPIGGEPCILKRWNHEPCND